MSNQTSNSIESSIVFIDAAVANRKSLLKDLRPGTEVVLLNSKQDGIDQITAALQGRSDIQSLQIISHGEPGTLYLGSTQLNSATLDRYSSRLQQWKAALTEDADLLLYGCNVASGSESNTSQGSPANFLQRLSQLTGADVAASNDLTGAQGDWDLEVTTGNVTITPVLSPTATARYQGNLGTITVTSAADSGSGTLRAALARAQAGDTIVFASTLAGKKITLTSGQIDITKSVTIDGSAAPGLVLSGNKASRIFNVSETNLNVAIKRLKFIDGKATSSSTSAGGAINIRDYSTVTVDNSTFQYNTASRGGAIRVGYGGSLIVRNSTFDSNNGASANDGFSAGAIATAGAGGPTGTGKLVIEGSTFTNNKGVNGGAVYNLLGPISIKNSVFKNNQSTKEGGALFTDGVSGSEKDTLGGRLTITGSRFEGNKAVAGGGAMYLWTYTADSVLIQDSTILGNSVTRGGQYNLGRGGGIEFAGSNLTLDKTTVANNIAPAQGGGLWVNNNISSVKLVNSTFSGNQATSDAGGGMFLNSADGKPVTITNSSIVNNLAGRDAGGIWTGSANSNDVKLTNTIFAGNKATVTYQGNANFTMAEGGGNIVQSGGRGPVVTKNSRYVADLKLGALQLTGNDYVHPLLTGSPAINTGTTTGAPTSDQRSRTRDSKPDAGAFEFGASTITALSRTSKARSVRGLNQRRSNQRQLQRKDEQDLLGRSDNTLQHNSQDALLEGGKTNRKFMRDRQDNGDSGANLLKRGQTFDFNKAPLRERSALGAIQSEQLGARTLLHSDRSELDFDRPSSLAAMQSDNSEPFTTKNSFL